MAAQSPLYPLITIGITCYNAESTIADAIQSAQKQDWPNCEIIVVDDGSTDRSREIIAQIQAHPTCLKTFITPSNLGASGARNLILEQAKGEYLAFFDDDDRSSPDRVRKQFLQLEEMARIHPQRQFACYAAAQREYANGYTCHAPGIGCTARAPEVDELFAFIFLGEKVRGVDFGHGTPSNSLFIRRETLQKIGGFDPQLRRIEDIDLALRLGYGGCGYTACAEALVTQQITSAADKTPDFDLQYHLRLIDKYHVRLEELGLYFYARQWPYLRYYYLTGQTRKLLQTLAVLACHHPKRTALRFLRAFLRRTLERLHTNSK